MADDGYQLDVSPQVVIIIVLVCVCFLVAIGYGVHRTGAARMIGAHWEDKKFNERNADQDQYMIDVRMAYRDAMMREHQFRPTMPPKRESYASSNQV